MTVAVGKSVDALQGDVGNAFALPQIEKIQRPGKVLFTPEGSNILAEQVARSIVRLVLRPVEKRLLTDRVTYKRRKVGPELNTEKRREPL